MALVTLCVIEELHSISYLFGSKLGSFKHRNVLSFGVLSKFGAMLLSIFCINFGFWEGHFEEALFTFCFDALAVNEIVAIILASFGSCLVTSEVVMVGLILVFAGKACEEFSWHLISGCVVLSYENWDNFEFLDLWIIYPLYFNWIENIYNVKKVPVYYP